MRSTLYPAVHATRWPLSTVNTSQILVPLAGISRAIRTNPLLSRLQRPLEDRAEARHPHSPLAGDLLDKEAFPRDCCIIPSVSTLPPEDQPEHVQSAFPKPCDLAVRLTPGVDARNACFPTFHGVCPSSWIGTISPHISGARRTSPGPVKSDSVIYARAHRPSALAQTTHPVRAVRTNDSRRFR